MFLVMMIGGDKRDRTADLLRARQALSQLSYIPNHILWFSLIILLHFIYHALTIEWWV